MIVQHNMSAENANRQLKINVKTNASSMEKLSSGYRINRAADDAAGLAISEEMRAQIRGLDKASLNCGDGMNLIQVADGALGEVHSMLDRLKELSVQAANDTLVDEDREAIQDEVTVLLVEIDRIGDETEFNTIKVFSGGRTGISESVSSLSAMAEELYPDVTLDGVSLKSDVLPVDISTSPNHQGEQYHQHLIRLQCDFSDNVQSLLYDALSSTSLGELRLLNYYSCSSVRVKYLDNDGNEQEKVCSLQIGDGHSDYIHCDFATDYAGPDDGDEPVSTRTFTYDMGDGITFDITQKIQLKSVPDEEGNENYKYYDISYSVKGNTDAEVDVLFSAWIYTGSEYFNVDSFYRDYCIDGNVVDRTGMWTSNPSYISYNHSGIHPMSENEIDGFVITNTENILPFAESVRWEGENRPDTFSIREENGYLGWHAYDEADSAGNIHLYDLNQPVHPSDLSVNDEPESFALVWSDRSITADEPAEFNFQYGIMLTRDISSSFSGREEKRNLWIQSGANAFGGQYLELCEMNTTVLGIHDIDMLTDDSATEANDKIEAAINAISNHRATLGAQYNRLEHAQAVDDNSEENVQASESKIRDTDMAKEMVVHAAKEILIQAGQAMLAQTNQITEGVLRLLR